MRVINRELCAGMFKTVTQDHFLNQLLLCFLIHTSRKPVFPHKKHFNCDYSCGERKFSEVRQKSNRNLYTRSAM